MQITQKYKYTDKIFLYKINQNQGYDTGYLSVSYSWFEFVSLDR